MKQSSSSLGRCYFESGYLGPFSDNAIHIPRKQRLPVGGPNTVVVCGGRRRRGEGVETFNDLCVNSFQKISESHI